MARQALQKYVFASSVRVPSPQAESWKEKIEGMRWEEEQVGEFEDRLKAVCPCFFWLCYEHPVEARPLVTVLNTHMCPRSWRELSGERGTVADLPSLMWEPQSGSCSVDICQLHHEHLSYGPTCQNPRSALPTWTLQNYHLLQLKLEEKLRYNQCCVVMMTLALFSLFSSGTLLPLHLSFLLFSGRLKTKLIKQHILFCVW